MISKILPKVFNARRNTAFSQVTPKDIQVFEGILGKKGLVTKQDEIAAHNTDWSKKFVGQSPLMLKPGSTEETAEVLKYCNERKLAIVPQGGNTGLVGGNTPVFDEIIMHTGRMNRILGFDDSYGIL